MLLHLGHVVGSHVFGIGLHKTGTTSLGLALALLGFRHRKTGRDVDLLRETLGGDFRGIETLLGSYESFDDWPWPLIYRPLAEALPDSRFILTVRRDSPSWFRSLCLHADRTGPTEQRRLVYGYAMPYQYRAEHVAVYEAHNAEVRRFFAERPGQLLEACWETGAGWRQLCEFLGTDIPDVPFPHKYRSALNPAVG